MLKIFIYLFLFQIGIVEVYSQSFIKGFLMSKNSQPVAGASVTIVEIGTKNILNYNISDNNGFFLISVNSKDKILQLTISSMGFKKIVKTIENHSQTLKFTLEKEITVLKEVVIKSSRISHKGDTLNYSVNAFKKQKDRTIADVLNNLPGIDVLNNGQILYQGEPISKFYIDGLDLLEGKYNLATNNLPYSEVTKVQVLENHQPIKILDSLVYTDRAAINIKLRKRYTFTGQVNVGFGFLPWLWDVNMSPMLFSKKKQMLSSFQSNNTGKDVSSQLKVLTIEELLEQFESHDEKKDWLAIQQFQSPDFLEKRWLNNKTNLITFNYLQKLRKAYELRVNLSYLEDYQQQKASMNTQFFTANDTIILFEKIHNKFFNNQIETSLTFQKNTSKNYLKNSLQFQGFWDQQLGIIHSIDESITQNLNNPYFKLSDNLKTLFSLGKQIAVLKTYWGFSQMPQTLKIAPGRYTNLLNNGNEYEEVTQNLQIKTFYTNSSLGLNKGWKQMSFSPKIGFQLEQHNLESKILTSSEFQNPHFINNLNWKHHKLYLKLLTQYKRNNWRFEIQTPVNFHFYRFNDKFLKKEQNLRRITFDPRLVINFELNNFWRIKSSTGISHQFGTINQLYYNYILKTYRNLQRINTPLPENINYNYSVSVRYRNPLKSIFITLVYANKITEKNLLFNTKILSDGATELQFLLQNNLTKSKYFSLRASKYFNDFNTNFTITANYNFRDYQQILNEKITSITNQTKLFTSKIETDFTKYLNAELSTTLQFSGNTVQDLKNQNLIQNFYNLNLNIYPNDDQYFGIKNELIENNSFSKKTINLFTDIVYRFTWKKKKKIDFEFQLSNLFNIINYTIVSMDKYSYFTTNLLLRPRQVLFKIRFAL